MKNIITETDLKDAILQLEMKWADEGKIVKDQFYLAVDSIRPINLIKSTFKEGIASRDLRDNIINTSVGLTAGYLSKIVFSGVMKSPLTKLLGTALMFGVTNIVARNPETVKSLGKGLFNMIRNRAGARVHRIDRNEPKQIASISSH
jgi:hypothetical protein